MLELELVDLKLELFESGGTDSEFGLELDLQKAVDPDQHHLVAPEALAKSDQRTCHSQIESLKLDPTKAELQEDPQLDPTLVLIQDLLPDPHQAPLMDPHHEHHPRLCLFLRVAESVRCSAFRMPCV